MSHNGNDRRGPMQGNIPGQGTFPSQDGPARPSARRQPTSRSSYAAAPQGASAYSRDNVHGRYTSGKSKSTTRRNVLIGAGVAAGVLVVGGVAAAASFVNSIGSRLNEGVDDTTKAVLQDQQVAAQELVSNWTDTSPFYMLLLGVDSMEERLDDEEEYGSDPSNYRSDTIILTRIDPGKKIVTLISIHRDTYCPEIDGKINSYYARGGASAVIEKISDFAEVPVSHYAEVNFDGLSGITDALGGVTVDVDMDIKDTIHFDDVTELQKGEQVLNGAQALFYCRCRYFADGDYTRMRHQRTFVKSLIAQVLSTTDPTKLVGVVNSCADMVITDMSVTEIASLANEMRGMNTEDGIYTAFVPSVPQMVDGVSYVVADWDQLDEMMKVIDAGQDPSSFNEGGYGNSSAE